VSAGGNVRGVRIRVCVLCLGAVLLMSCVAAAPASAKYKGQCGNTLTFRDGTNHKIRYAVTTARRSNCRTARRTAASYLNRVGRYARAGRCSSARCANAAPRGWRCSLTTYAARHKGRLADCTRRRVSVQARVWPPVQT